MRLIDANALIAEYDRVHIGEPGKARQLILNAPTIELRCEECEALNKTRLLIPQPERKEYMRTVFIECECYLTKDKRRAVLEDMKHEAGEDVHIVLLEPFMHVSEHGPQWIPVTEKLPEEKGRYLVYYTLNGTDRGIRTATFYPGGWLEWDVDGTRGMARVFAWMPLPEAYRED